MKILDDLAEDKIRGVGCYIATNPAWLSKQLRSAIWSKIWNKCGDTTDIWFICSTRIERALEKELL